MYPIRFAVYTTVIITFPDRPPGPPPRLKRQNMIIKSYYLKYFCNIVPMSGRVISPCNGTHPIGLRRKVRWLRHVRNRFACFTTAMRPDSRDFHRHTRVVLRQFTRPETPHSNPVATPKAHPRSVSLSRENN